MWGPATFGGAVLRIPVDPAPSLLGSDIPHVSGKLIDQIEPKNDSVYNIYIMTPNKKHIEQEFEVEAGRIGELVDLSAASVPSPVTVPLEIRSEIAKLISLNLLDKYVKGGRIGARTAGELRQLDRRVSTARVG